MYLEDKICNPYELYFSCHHQQNTNHFLPTTLQHSWQSLPLLLRVYLMSS